MDDQTSQMSHNKVNSYCGTKKCPLFTPQIIVKVAYSELSKANLFVRSCSKANQSV